MIAAHASPAFILNNSSQHAPILILGHQNQYVAYIGEILIAEGFNEFQLDSLDSKRVTLSYLKQFRLVLLASCSVSASQSTTLQSYVSAGGNLIAFRPDKKLSELFGIVDAEAIFRESYLSIDTTTDIGKGLSNSSLPFHGSGDTYHLKNGKKICSFLINTVGEAEFPAVAFNDYGQGHALAFLYNLPQSIIGSRQGNADLAGQEADGIPGIRAMDMFTGHWVDTAKNTLNHADEQMHLLAHAIEKMMHYSTPLPRFWYFPDALQSLVVLNNDGENSEEKDFEPHFADVQLKQARMSLYILETEKVSKKAVDQWRSSGHEISGHPDDTKNATDPDWSNMSQAITKKLDELKRRYGIEKMNTVVNHWFVWCGKDADGSADFAAQALLESSKGIRLDANYAHYDNKANEEHFLGNRGLSQGNFTGSGIPMKFAGRSGHVLDIYQLLNNVYDQQYMEHQDAEGFFQCFKGLMDRSLNDHIYSVITVKTHTNEYYFSKPALARMLDYAKSHRIPVWTADHLLRFLEVKHQIRFTDISFSKNSLVFDIISPVKYASGLTLMIPYEINGRALNAVRINGHAKTFDVRWMRGHRYGFVILAGGMTQKLIADFGSEP
jgi:hypothetical protein